MAPERDPEPEITLRMHDPRIVDSQRRLLDTSAHSEEDLRQIVRVLDAVFRWRKAESRLSEASRRFMRLGEKDMLALRFAIVASSQGRITTARDLAEHLGISTAATTKLLDRLEAGGHIRRERHPTDRRALAIEVDPGTLAVAEETVGREHARRFGVVAALAPAEREVVIRFLEALSATSEGDWGDPGGPE